MGIHEDLVLFPYGFLRFWGWESSFHLFGVKPVSENADNARNFAISSSVLIVTNAIAPALAMSKETDVTGRAGVRK